VRANPQQPTVTKEALPLEIKGVITQKSAEAIVCAGQRINQEG